MGDDVIDNIIVVLCIMAILVGSSAVAMGLAERSFAAVALGASAVGCATALLSIVLF